ncbi:uncharacterized protein LOC125943717 isoform X2 [Dermacentor silvarum]|uniref:uncharacterized protein LOC125943717 isoform X2 n=1 Tax=Dermacentor silvarum TaxID=543639 RepID=UPI002100AFAF|nr:uncharacterized protein LOC125943717 isoform X2 [Dermacentor silvarum]
MEGSQLYEAKRERKILTEANDNFHFRPAHVKMNADRSAFLVVLLFTFACTLLLQTANGNNGGNQTCPSSPAYMNLTCTYRYRNGNKTVTCRRPDNSTCTKRTKRSNKQQQGKCKKGKCQTNGSS